MAPRNIVRWSETAPVTETMEISLPAHSPWSVPLVTVRRAFLCLAILVPIFLQLGILPQNVFFRWKHNASDTIENEVRTRLGRGGMRILNNASLAPAAPRPPLTLAEVTALIPPLHAPEHITVNFFGLGSLEIIPVSRRIVFVQPDGQWFVFHRLVHYSVDFLLNTAASLEYSPAKTDGLPKAYGPWIPSSDCGGETILYPKYSQQASPATRRSMQSAHQGLKKRGQDSSIDEKHGENGLESIQVGCSVGESPADALLHPLLRDNPVIPFDSFPPYPAGVGRLGFAALALASLFTFAAIISGVLRSIDVRQHSARSTASGEISALCLAMAIHLLMVAATSATEVVFFSVTRPYMGLQLTGVYRWMLIFPVVTTLIAHCKETFRLIHQEQTRHPLLVSMPIGQSSNADTALYEIEKRRRSCNYLVYKGFGPEGTRQPHLPMRLFGVQLICTVTMGGGRILPIPSSKSYILIFTTLPALIVFIVEMWRTWAFSSEKTHHLVLRWYEKAKATAARWARVGIQSKGSPTVPVTTSVSHPVELGRPPRLVLRPRTEDGAGENGRGEEDAEGMGADEREDDADEPFQKRIRMIEAAETELTKSIVASCEKFEVGLGNPVLNHVGIWIAYITELSLQLNTDPLLAMDLNLLCMVAEIVAFILIPLMALLYHANQIEESLAQLSRVQEARRVAALEVAGYRSRRAFLKYIFFELREPFHRMQLGLEALGATAVRLAPEKVETIGMMQTAAESMSSVMDSVMTLSQFEETAFQLHTVPLEIRDVMDTIVLQFSPWAKQANISLARIVDPAVPSMLAIDRVKMIQVCCNFISNALKVLGARSEGVMHQVDDGFDGGRANSQRKSGSVVLAVRLLADVPTEPIGDQTEVLDDHAMMALLQSKAREEMDHYRSLLIRGQMDPRRTDVNILGGSVASTSRERPHSVLFGPCRRPAGISLSQGYVQAIAGALSKRTLEHGRGRIVKSTTSKSEEDDPQNDSDLGDEGRDGSTSGNDASASTPTATASTAAASPMSIDMAASTSGMPHCTGRARSRRNVIPATPTGTAFTGREVVLSISVLDDGPGMGSESLSKLFQPFHSSLAGSTDAPIVTAGAGLGLAISRELVAASGGFIGCLSQLGRGTAFVCVLPLRLYRRTS